MSPILSHHPCRRAGFSLLELAIVMMIIGLLASGIATGVSLLGAAELQKVMGDKGKILSVINTYKSRYDAIPGDHGRAEDLFGAANTDNGNDNGLIDPPATNNDSWLFWQHLALSGLWTGSFTGDNGINTPNIDSDAVINSNVPAGPKETGYSIYYDSTDTGLGNTPRHHFIVAGRAQSTTNLQTFGGWLSTEDAASLDIKYDDGVANTGEVRTYVATAGHDTTSCTTTAAPDHVYNTSSTTARCNILLMFEP